MAHSVVNLINPKTGEQRKAPIGFSWTTLFFGVFPALCRGDWKWLLIMLVVAFFTCGVSYFVFPFVYNRLYYNDCLKEGFIHRDSCSVGCRTFNVVDC